MKSLQIVLSIGILFFFCQYSQAQENEKITIGEKILYDSEILDQQREIFVYLPFGYEKQDRSYPVIYTTDAEISFLLMSAMVDIYPSMGYMPKAIVIGIKNRGPRERYVDFAPEIKDKPESGNADDFIEFMAKELFPYVEENYRTQPFRILHGHSFLGMFGSYVFLTQPDLFNAYILSSPDLRWIDDKIGSHNIHIKKPTFIYISQGANERPSPEIEKFNEFIESMDQVTVKYVVNENEDHQSNAVISSMNGLRFIYDGWRLPKPPNQCSRKELKEHYVKLSEKYGYEITIPY